MAKRKNVRYICPECYGNIDPTQIHYACTNPECTPNFLALCSETESKRYCSVYRDGEEIDVEKSEYLGLDPRGPSAKTSKDHIIRGSPNGACDICRNKNTLRLCPRCHAVIPPTAERRGTTIIPVMGSDGVGKSHYLASLISVLKDGYGDEFGTRFKDTGEKTTVRFENEYAKPVFENGKCLPPTPSYSDESSRQPLLYNMVNSETGDTERTVAFIDTSGKDLDETDNLSSLNVSGYISGASGIIYVVDPLAIPGVREKLGLPETDGPDIAGKLSYIADIIRNNNRLKPKEKIDVPLAVAINKCDMLIRSPVGNEDEDALFGPESAVHLVRGYGTPDLEILEQIDAELEEYLRRNADPEFLEAVGEFRNHHLFAVSAIGSNPSDGNLVKGVAPQRVEDPMIWFLNMTERRRWF